jgi:transcriptional regulator with XRE-family HTH domain
MRGHQYPPCSTQLRQLRESHTFTSQELAARIGLPEPWLRDLEAYDDEMYCNISLAHLQRLALLLGVSVAKLLLVDPSQGVGDRIPFGRIVDRLRAFLASSGESPEAFGARVGWEVDRVLDQAADCWEWCPEELKEIAAALGINWVAALPEPLDAPPREPKAGA